jgi:pantetheine-phosphate adenylyltransferase
MNIIEQAEKIFDKVIIAQGNNPDKEMRQSLWMPYSILPFHETVQYHGLLSEYLKTLDYADVTVIRGLRSGYDLDYEMNQLRILQDYGCKLPVIYFLCDKEYSHVSSSMIRGLSKFPSSEAEKYIPRKYDYAIVPLTLKR